MSNPTLIAIVAYMVGILTGASWVGIAIGKGPFWDSFRDAWMFGLLKWVRRLESKWNNSRN